MSKQGSGALERPAAEIGACCVRHAGLTYVTDGPKVSSFGARVGAGLRAKSWMTSVGLIGDRPKTKEVIP